MLSSCLRGIRGRSVPLPAGAPRPTRLPAMVLGALLLSACATPRVVGPKTAGFAAWPESASAASAEMRVAPKAATASAPVPKLIGSDGYTRFSVGSFTPAGDIDGLDTGYFGEVAFGTEVLPFLSLEAALGVFAAEGDFDTDLTGVPLVLNGRLEVPILIVELYGGLGVGGMYADYNLGVLEDSDFLLCGTAFVGLEVGLGKLAVGAEYRYITAEEADPGFTIEGHCGLLTFTLPF